jgi:hypothetical protein
MHGGRFGGQILFTGFDFLALRMLLAVNIGAALMFFIVAHRSPPKKNQSDKKVRHA